MIPVFTGTDDFPTRVGMARRAEILRILETGFPHPRGDGPMFTMPVDQVLAISPPAWGWPAVELTTEYLTADFPTRVGMARRNFAHPACRS